MERELPDVEETIVVDRDADAELDRTIVRPRRGRASDVEETIVVDRQRAADEVEETIVVARGGDEVEETIVVDRGRAADEVDETIIVDREGHELEEHDTDRTIARPSHDDETIIVDRSAPAVSLPPVPSLRRARPERRRGIAPPPIPAGFAPAARAAVGPGAVEHYAARELSPPPAAPILPEGPAATRVSDPTLPSVARRARRTAVVAIAAFAGACLVSVTGLALILVWAL